jgi:hypothetical protein
MVSSLCDYATLKDILGELAIEILWAFFVKIF